MNSLNSLLRKHSDTHGSNKQNKMCDLTWRDKQMTNRIVNTNMLHKSYDKYSLYIYILNIQIHKKNKAAIFLINIDPFFV